MTPRKTPMSRAGSKTPPTVLRYAVLATALAAVLYLALRWPSRALGGPDAVRSLGCAVGIAWAGTLLGRLLEALVLTKRAHDDARAVQGAMAGTIGRLFSTLGMLVGVIAIEPFPLLAFGLQAGIAYVSLLALEVFVNLRDFGQNPGDRGAEVSAGNGPKSEA